MAAKRSVWRVAFSARQDAEREFTAEELLQFLQDLEKKDELPIQQCVDIVMKSNANTCSITRDHPYRYFYVHRTRKGLDIRVTIKDREVAFTIPYTKIS